MAKEKSKKTKKKASAEKTQEKSTKTKKPVKSEKVTGAKETKTNKKETKEAGKKVPACNPDFHWINPYICVKDGQGAINFYKKAFGFTVRDVMRTEDGKGVMHAELMHKNFVIMLSSEIPMAPIKSPLSLKGTTSNIYLYTEDVDAFYKKAVAAGAKSLQAPKDEFWGDRWCLLEDPEGHIWGVATHIGGEKK